MSQRGTTMIQTTEANSYFIGMPGEVSYAKALAEVRELLANPFTDGRILYRIASQPAAVRNARRPWVPAGALHASQMAAALRELTQGEG
jgi:hypothetical protein